MEDMRGLIVQAQKGDKQVRDTLIEENLGLVHHIVKRFLNRGYDAEELFQIGCIGLMKAIDHFDTDYDVKFSTYAVPLIMGEIKRFLRDNGIIKVSRTLRENAWKIKNAQRELSGPSGREVTIDEIAAATGLTVEEIVMAQEADVEVESLSKVVYQGDGSQISLGERIADEKDEHEVMLNRLLLQQLLQALSEDERYLIKLRYFDNITQTETAKHLGISQVQVSRLEKKILEKMKKMG
ncbi:MAG: SigF/SigG family RNA polymerase sporulation sigma factor [Lachnospiraceae bacterium]|nr:SigF/SigG family RNA polymerase sporulation sigma factor [Lachnospiraceae bacterium]